jgi:hypothetical protein
VSRKSFKTKSVLRAFLATSVALVLITSVSPGALASGQGKSGDHGKKVDKTTVDSILKAIANSPIINGEGKKFENDGKALEGQSRSVLKKLAKLVAGNPAILTAINAYAGSVDPATTTFQIAIKAAKTTYKSALAVGATDTSKQSAETVYKTAVALAVQNFNTSITAAKLVLKTALMALIPAPSPSPSST